MRRVACILLIREDGKFLLQHRTDDAPRLPGYWALFGGGIDEGETPEQAVVREAKEELDINLTGHTLSISKVFFNDLLPSDGAELNVFTAPFAKQGPITQYEGQGMDWYTVADLDHLKIAPQDYEAIITVMQQQKNGR